MSIINFDLRSDPKELKEAVQYMELTDEGVVFFVDILLANVKNGTFGFTPDEWSRLRVQDECEGRFIQAVRKLSEAGYIQFGLYKEEKRVGTYQPKQL